MKPTFSFPQTAKFTIPSKSQAKLDVKSYWKSLKQNPPKERPTQTPLENVIASLPATYKTPHIESSLRKLQNELVELNKNNPFHNYKAPALPDLDRMRKVLPTPATANYLDAVYKQSAETLAKWNQERVFQTADGRKVTADEFLESEVFPIFESMYQKSCDLALWSEEQIQLCEQGLEKVYQEDARLESMTLEEVLIENPDIDEQAHKDLWEFGFARYTQEFIDKEKQEQEHGHDHH